MDVNKKNEQCIKKQYYNIGNNNLININIQLNEKNKIIWFIKLHDYEKTLKLIDDALLSEENEEEYKNLKKNKIICLNGLCDWETLFSEGGSIINEDKKFN